MPGAYIDCPKTTLTVAPIAFGVEIDLINRLEYLVHLWPTV